MTADLPPVSGQSVIGSDERIQITDTTEFPFSAIAYLELEDGAEQPLGSCTATFIGPDALLTAAHCLWDFEAGDWVESSVRVVPGKNGDTEPFGSEIAADWWVPDAYTETGATVWDWGLIKLPDAALSAETGWLTMAVLDTAVLAGRDFEPTIIGYPADKPTATMWGLIRPAFLAVTDFTLVYDIDTAPGQSGSAIWSAAEGPNLGKIVGIHTRGGAVNSGSRIDQELLDDVLEGCALMGCTIAMDSTPASPPPGPELAFKSYSVAIARD
jgi:glutamyl endopeptidase